MNTNLQKSNVWKNCSLQIISLTILFLISFFFIFWAGSYFEADIFPLENRSTIYSTFDVNIFDEYVDSVFITLLTVLWISISLGGKIRIVSAVSYGSLAAAALFTNFSLLLDASVFVSIPIITSIFIYHRFSATKIIQFQTNLLMSFFSAALLCIAVLGMISTLLSFSNGFPEWIKNPSNDIFLLISSFSPFLIFFLVLGSSTKLLVIYNIKELKNKILQQQIPHYELKRKSTFLFLIVLILLSIFFTLLPHQSFINSENEIVGADTVTYVNWLNDIRMNEDNLMQQVFVVQNLGDRPLSLLFFYTVLTIFPDNPYQTIDRLPLIFSPLLVLTVFFLTRELTSNEPISLLASFLTAISFQPLIGIYSGLYANWFALIFGYLSIIFLLRYIRKKNNINGVFFAILLFLIMFSHVYTWTLLILFISIFLIVSFRLKLFQQKRIALVFLIITVSIAFDAGKSLMTDTPLGLVRDVSIMYKDEISGSQSSIWSNLSQTFLVYGGGLFGNFLILSLCIYWLFRSNLREMPNLFIAIFLSLAILPILFGGELIQSRVLYNIPFQIPAAIGLFFLTNLHKGRLLIIATSIWILVTSIQAISNFI